MRNYRIKELETENTELRKSLKVTNKIIMDILEFEQKLNHHRHTFRLMISSERWMPIRETILALADNTGSEK